MQNLVFAWLVTWMGISEDKSGILTVSAYITLAPPPATIVQIRPFGFKTVNFKDALVYNRIKNTGEKISNEMCQVHVHIGSQVTIQNRSFRNKDHFCYSNSYEVDLRSYI